MSAKTKRTPISAPSQGLKLKTLSGIRKDQIFQDSQDLPELQKAIDNDEPSLITWENQNLISYHHAEEEAYPPDWSSIFETCQTVEEWTQSWL